jgi:hypothetical protein
MDSTRFDQFTKLISGSSRRTMLKSAMGAAIGGALVTAGITTASAAPPLKGPGKVCKQGSDCLSGVCIPSGSNKPGSCSALSCINQGWKNGVADWSCPSGYRLPTTAEWDAVATCVTAEDAAMFTDMNDVGTAVGGCGCTWDAEWCTFPSIETMRIGRACGDHVQLNICVLA